MAVDFFIPKLGDNVDQVTIVNWLVDDGAAVNEGDEVVEVETDKAVVPVPANGKGHLHIGPYKAGDSVPVMTVIATIGAEAENFAPGSERRGDEVAAETPPAPPRPTEGEVEERSGTPPDDGNVQEAGSELAVAFKITPVAQKIAAERGVDLQTIARSGDHERITKEDVLQVAAPSVSPVPSSPASERVEEQPQPSSQPQPSQVQTDADVAQSVPLKGIRGIIFRRMAESVHTTARVTLITEVDTTEFVKLREQLKARFSQEWGFTPGYNDLLGVIVANALRKFPYMNARISAAGDAIEHLKPVNMGMAVDTERGLLVTVIRNADTKGLQEFGAEFRALVERARAGKSAPDDLSGGTFTITNLGMYRVDGFTPVINLPEAAILGVGRIVAKPVARGEEIVVRKMMSLSLVFDHRVADGAPAARFLDYVCELIEEPYLLFLTQR